MATCPNCGHDPSGFSTSFMPIYRCSECGTEFCHNCGTSTANGFRCPDCGNEETEEAWECHGD